MKKTGLFILLGIVLLVTVILIQRNRSPFGNRNASFSIENTGKINRVQISEGDKELSLTREDGTWILNSVFEVRKTAISFLLKTLSGIEIKSPVSEELFRELVTVPGVEPVVVSITGSGRIRRSYLIYKTPDPEFGTIVKRTERSMPFFVSLPGYELDPGSHFVADENFWKPYSIFDLNPDEIARVEIKYLDRGISGFNIDLTGDSVILRGSDLQLLDHNDRQVKRYLSYFTFIPFETWAFSLDIMTKNELIATQPEIEMILTLRDGEVKNLKLWTRTIDSEGEKVPDTDRLYGELNNTGEIFIVKYFDIDPLIKSSEYLIKQ